MAARSEHIFLQEQRIAAVDLRTIIDLTAVGELEWGWDNRAAAIGTNVDRVLGQAYANDHNLAEVRAGFVPTTKAGTDEHFNYVRLTDRTGEQHYVADDLPTRDLLPLARRVLRAGLFACEVEGGRLGGVMQACDTCERETGQAITYLSPYGLRGAEMGGSRKTECLCCGTATPVSSAA